jgi:hypothetical protein
MTEAEFSQQLSQLSSVAADLNRESDSINELLAQYESKIRALNVGLEVSVKTDSGRLGWEKCVFDRNPDGSKNYTSGKREWGLAIDGSPALDCSREERIEALESIPDLVVALTEQAQMRVDVIRKAKDLLNK